MNKKRSFLKLSIFFSTAVVFLILNYLKLSFIQLNKVLCKLKILNLIKYLKTNIYLNLFHVVDLNFFIDLILYNHATIIKTV